VAEHHLRSRLLRAAGVSRESASERRLLQQHVEVVARDEAARDLLRRSAAERHGCGPREREQAGERLRARAKPFVFGRREHTRRAVRAAFGPAFDVLTNANKLLRVGRRQVAQHEAVQHGEDAAVDADTDRDRHDRRGREAGAEPQSA